jgi:cytochrome c
MGFAGEPNVKIRANIIAYLRTLSPNPPPLPTEAEIKADTASAKPTAQPASGGPAPSFDAMLASADPATGQKLTMQQGCVACHSFNEGGKAGIGPNLYGVIGAPHAHMQGYDYSAALKAKQGPWTYAELNEWLTKPAAYAPGTKMTYAGLADEKKRADIIAYLRSLSPHPEPLPAPAKGG